MHMPTYTKYTITDYQDSILNAPNEMVSQLFTTASQMAAEGKTDGNYLLESVHLVRREWLDQAAAQAWVDYIIPLHQAYGVVLTSVDILDIPPI